jgi:hypothetical protein
MSPRSKIRAGKCRGRCREDPVTIVVAVRIDGENLELTEGGEQLRARPATLLLETQAPRPQHQDGMPRTRSGSNYFALSGDAQTKVAGC